jgi:hypothetical protein
MASNTTVTANRVNANEMHSNNLILNGGISGNFLDFHHNLETNLAAATAIAASATTATLLSNHVHTSAADGGRNITLTLPAAIAGTHIAYRQTAEFDGGNFNVIVDCATDETFVTGQRIVAPGQGSQGTVIASAHSQPAAGTGSTMNKLTINIAATTHFNWGAEGSAIHFYAPENGKWLVNIHSVANGTGAGGSIIFTAV